MDIFNVLTLVGGLCLFLFGMNLMGQALERRAGGKLRSLLDKMTSRVFVGFLTGLGITAIIQSSSATTVMVVGFVNSGLMTLRQAINVIMGANVGTTVTAWLLSLAGIDSGSLWIQLLKPSSFTPVLALVGIIFYMFCKDAKKKDTGTILLGFATLMFGMETMSGAVAGLKDVPEFTQLFLMFRNPVLGVLVGAVLTGIIQSSSASVGILQALSVTGSVSYAAAIPIIMGQNIGTCVTAILSSVGTNKNARRAAVVHLMFNVIGVVVLLTVYCVVKALFAPAILDRPATMYGIAIAHSVFNILCTAMLLPAGGLLEKLAIRLVPDAKRREETVELDSRLLATPALALGRARDVTVQMAQCAVRALENALDAFTAYTPELARSIREDEECCDHYEDIIGTYLVQLSSHSLSDGESQESTELLKTIGDFERISDHAVNVLESAEELQSKKLSFSPAAMAEYQTLARATRRILHLSLDSFRQDDPVQAAQVEPLEQVIDALKEELRTRHILRMRRGQCSIEAGFVWVDLLTDLERTSDHCSNTGLIIIDTLKRVREVGGADFSYSSDYDIVARLKTVADSYKVTMVIVHHTRKLAADDKFDMIAGTNGLLGAADGGFVLSKEKRTSNAAVLDVTGRDQEDQRLHLTKNPETLVWELESVETELWQEPPDPFLESIAAFLSSAGERWEGTASELCSLLNLDCKPNVLSLRLSIGSVRLLRDHDIRYKASRNHGGRKISLWKEMDSVSKGDDRDGLLVGSGEA